MNQEDPGAKKAITVTQPYLPPLAEFLPYLEKIWASKVLTNGGPFHQQLEDQLAKVLGVPHVAVFCNGTIALVTALKALGVKGEVITTPFTFVATAHALQWNGIRPLFVDIDPETFGILPDRIESGLTQQTSAILPVHCYGYPCDVDAIDDIADRHGIPVLYDAAHCFGASYRGHSLASYGDLAMLSFHATKVFNTFEGGALVVHDAALMKQIVKLRNFGFVDEIEVESIGINGKMNEVQAAFGLLQLGHVENSIERNRLIAMRYEAGLEAIAGLIHVRQPGGSVGNHSYFPVLVTEEFPLSRDELYERLKAHGIRTRRYFFPLLSNMKMYRDLPSAHPDNLPNANRIAKQIICLPIYPELALQTVDRIIEIIANG